MPVVVPNYTAPNLTSGLDTAVASTIDSVSIFAPMFLLFVFVLIWLGGSRNQKNRTGNADYPFWAVIASMGTLLMALMMSLGDTIVTLIEGLTLGVVVAVTLVTGIWFLLSKQKGEL